MQHDVFANPGPRTRATRRYLAVLQADVVAGPSRLVCPLFRAAFVMPSRATPSVTVLGEAFVMGIEASFPLQLRLLRTPVGSVAGYRDDIVLALDWLFTGF